MQFFKYIQKSLTINQFKKMSDGNEVVIAAAPKETHKTQALSPTPQEAHLLVRLFWLSL
jgi:hypothetical protein